MIVQRGRVVGIADGRTQLVWTCSNGPGERCGDPTGFPVGPDGAVATPRISTQLPAFPAYGSGVAAMQPPFESVTGLYVSRLLTADASSAVDLLTSRPSLVVRISTGALPGIAIEVQAGCPAA